MNNGVCMEGTCDCPDGFIGTTCNEVDLTELQTLLDSGITPIELFNAGVSIDDIYGKNYHGGVIYFLNTTTGTGLIASSQDLGSFE